MEQIQCVLTAWKNKFCRDLLLCQTQGKKLPALSAWIVLTHIMAQSFPHCLVISLLTGAACAHQDWATPGNFSTAPTTAELPGSACAWLKKIKKPAVGKNRNALNFPQWGHNTSDCRCCWNTYCLWAKSQFYFKKNKSFWSLQISKFTKETLPKPRHFFLLVSRKFKSTLKIKYISCTELVLQKQQLSTPKLVGFSERFT